MQFLIIAQDCFQYDYLINELPRNCTKQFCALYCTKPMMSTKSVRAACKVSLSNWDHIGPPGTSGDHQWLLLTPRDHYGPPMSTRDIERQLRITRDHKHHPSPPTGLPETSRDHRPWPPETTRDNWRQLGFWAIISYCTQLFCAIIVFINTKQVLRSKHFLKNHCELYCAVRHSCICYICIIYMFNHFFISGVRGHLVKNMLIAMPIL